MNVDYNPYEGRQVTGATDTVLSRGRLVIEDGKFVGRAGAGVVHQARGTKLGRCRRMLSPRAPVHRLVARRVVFPTASVRHLRSTSGIIAAFRVRRCGVTRRRRGRRRRSRRVARHRRHARARQRAGPHRMGRLRHGDARGGGRRRDDDRRHAAQQRAGDDERGGARDEAGGGARTVSRGRRVLGRRRAGQCGRARRPRGRRRPRLQVFPGAVRRRRISSGRTNAICAARCRSWRAAACPLLVHAEWSRCHCATGVADSRDYAN